jgi:hypothetical protein
MVRDCTAILVERRFCRCCSLSDHARRSDFPHAGARRIADEEDQVG